MEKHKCVKGKPPSHLESIRILENCGRPRHWIDQQHEDDENDRVLNKELMSHCETMGRQLLMFQARNCVQNVSNVQEPMTSRIRRTCASHKRAQPCWMSHGKNMIRARWIDVYKLI